MYEIKLIIESISKNRKGRIIYLKILKFTQYVVTK